MSADTSYRITADTATNPNAVADVQSVPLNYAPFVGVDAWGAGDPVRTSAPGVRPATYSSTQVYWGIPGGQFYDSSVDAGYSDGQTWNETAAVAALQAKSGVTCVGQ